MRQEEIDLKHKKIARILKNNDLEGVLFSTQTNFKWFTGGKLNNVIRNEDISLVYLLITDSKRYIVSSNSDLERVYEEELLGLGFEPLKFNWYDEDVFVTSKKIGINGPLGADFTSKNIINIESDISDIRRDLSDSEISRYIVFCKEYAKIITDYCLHLKKGLTERELASGLEYACSQKGIRMPVLMVGSDERIFNYRHPVFTDKRIDRYALIATVAEKDGICANVTRSIYFGSVVEPLNSRQKKVNHIISAYYAASKIGVSLHEIFDIGKLKYAEIGEDDEWKNHIQGGISAYKPLEYQLHPKTAAAIRHNNIVAFNPTIKGVKSEDPFIVREEGSEIAVHDDRWPYEEVEAGVEKFKRPLILEL